MADSSAVHYEKLDDHEHGGGFALPGSENTTIHSVELDSFSPDRHNQTATSDIHIMNSDESRVFIEEHPRQHKSTLRQTISEGGSKLSEVLYNMLNAVVGAGIVGIPHVYTECGLIGGIILIVVFAIITVYSLRLLIKTAKKVDCHTYEELCQSCFGNVGYISVLFALFVFDFGALLTYLIILGDASSNVICNFWDFCNNFDRQCMILLLSLTLILPWCLFRDISKIEKVSALSIGTVLLIIIVVLYEFIDFQFISPNNSSDSSSSSNNVTYDYFRMSGFITSIGTIAFAFVCHDSSFLLYNTLSNPTTERWNQLTFRAISLATVITLSFSMFGYLTFGQSTQDNILNNYDSDDPFVIITRIIYVFTMALTYPTAFYVVRHVLYAIYVAIRFGLSTNNDKTSIVVPSLQQVSLRTHLWLTLPAFFLSVSLALVLNDLGFVMNITGSLAAVYIAFVMPAFCCLKVWYINQDENLSILANVKNSIKENGWEIMTQAGFPLLLGVLGAIIAIMSTSYSFYVKFA